MVSGVTEDNHAETDTKSRDHQQGSSGKPPEQESSDESGEESDYSVDDGGVRLVDVGRCAQSDAL